MVSNTNITHFPDQPREEIFRPSRQQRAMALTRELQRNVLDDPQNIWYRYTNPVARIRSKGIYLGKHQRAIVLAIHNYIIQTDQNPYFFKQSTIARYIKTNRPRVNEAIKSLERYGILWNYGINWNKKVRCMLIPVGGLEGWHLGSKIFPMPHWCTVLVQKLVNLQRKSINTISDINRVNCHFVPLLFSNEKRKKLCDNTAAIAAGVSERLLSLLSKTFWFEPSKEMKDKRRFATLPIKRYELKIKGHAAAIRDRIKPGRKHIDPEVYYELHPDKHFKDRRDGKTSSKYSKINQRCREKLLDLCKHGIVPDVGLALVVQSQWRRSLPKQKIKARYSRDSLNFKKLVVAVTWLKWKQRITNEMFTDTIHWMAEYGINCHPWRYLKKWDILMFFVDQGNSWLKFLILGDETKRIQYRFGFPETDFETQVKNTKDMFVRECWGDESSPSGQELMTRFHAMITEFVSNKAIQYLQEERDNAGLTFAIIKDEFHREPSIMQMYCHYMNRVVWKEKEFKPIKDFCAEVNWDGFVRFVRSGDMGLRIDLSNGGNFWRDKKKKEYSNFWHLKRNIVKGSESDF